MTLKVPARSKLGRNPHIDERKKRAAAKTRPFRFLDLPPEIRAEIFDLVATNETAYVSKRFRSRLVAKTPLLTVNRQIRNEFQTSLYLKAGTLNAEVERFHFQHIVTFYNKLSQAEQRSLFLKSQPSVRKMFITLCMSHGQDDDMDLLCRWLRRAGNPTKSGSTLDCEYTVKAKTKLFDDTGLGFRRESRMRDLMRRLRSSAGCESVKEAVKISRALKCL